MMGNPPCSARPRVPSYASQSSEYTDDYNGEDDIDVEKQRFANPELDPDYADSPHSSASSRITSHFYEEEPILSPSRRHEKKEARSYPKVPFRLTCGPLSPRWMGRFFSLGLLAIVVMFILSLTRAHWKSVKIVESLQHKPPPPPPAWEKFPFLKRYHGGIRTLVNQAENKPEYPLDSENDEASVESANQAKAAGGAKREIAKSKPYNPYGQQGIVECLVDDGAQNVSVPSLQVYDGVPRGMPDAVMGSYNLLGLQDDICYERYGRLGPYGYGYSKRLGGSGTGMNGDREGIEAVWAKDGRVDWRHVDWGSVIETCHASNKHRFANKAGETDPSKKAQIPRKAVIIRTWTDYYYDEEDILYLRSLVTELSLHSGGEYDVHFLVHVKDPGLQIWANDEIYQKVLNDALPAEFRGLATLWSEKQMELIYAGLEQTVYRDLPIYGVYRSTFMPVAYFALQHPEYEYFWQLEVDQRYTGHWYHLFDKTGKWAEKQPRKGLWERNARFYVPSEHGSWEDFSHMVRVQTEHGTASKSNLHAALAKNPSIPDDVKHEMEPQKPEKTIWGPEPPLDDKLDTTHDVVPPHSEKADKMEWGVGEPADLILFNPIFDPEGTNWLLVNDVTGYNTTRGLPPRRTAINTFGRYSRKLLLQMHNDTTFSRKSMFSEMWPPTTCLHHGFKAVYAPHPVYIDRRWPTAFLAATFNGGRNGAAGGARMSVFSEERQHNFLGTTWYYDAGFAPNLWKRWFGLKVDNDGGEQEELLGEGRMCLRGVMLHPVKQVDLDVQQEIVE